MRNEQLQAQQRRQSELLNQRLNDRGYESSSSSAEDLSNAEEDDNKDRSYEGHQSTTDAGINNYNATTTENNTNKESAYLGKDLIPPPEPLLPKTIAPSEPLRTGAPTPFLKLKPFCQDHPENPSRQIEDVVDKSKYKIDNPIMNEQSLKTLFIQEFKSNENNPLVYNRHQAQMGTTSAYNNSAYQILKSEINPMTLLVNVKELISVDQKNPNQSGAPIVLPYYTPIDQNDKTLVFESRFESGNLAMAFKTSDFEYNLVLSNDINTKGHTQWFFFRVTNIFKDTTVKFSILNHTKPDSLFNYGMKVLVYSEYIFKSTGVGWHRDGKDIAYFQNNFKKDSVGRSRYYYTLTFTYDFQHDQDTVFFAYSYPYTYSDLTDDLTNMEKDAIKSEYLSRNVLCRTIAGNKCEYLTITAKNHPDQKSERKGVFLSSRIHPGESNSSWMMKGIIDFLVGASPEAKVLREKFVFKIVPMLNPDGVINGNYRCSLAGADLNRRWKAPSKLLFPEVFETKKLCKQFQKERQIVLYCDLHGHSRNKNIFMYGNNYSENPESTRLFPFIMSKVLDCFAFDMSRFSIHRSKEATARVSMWKELKIPAVYTMEASFCGPQIGKNNGLHFTTEQFMEAGKKLCIALLIYCDIDVPRTLRDMQKNKKKKKKNQTQQVNPQLLNEEIAQELKDYTRKQLIAELMGDKKLLVSGSKDEAGEDGGGSESDPSEDNMEEEEMAKIIPIKVIPAKKKTDTKKQQLPIKKHFKQQQFQLFQNIFREEIKEQKVQQTQAKKSPTKKFNSGGSFFDRVRLPKSYGMRRVEMVDAWTQTSNRGSDNEESKKEDPSKDEGVQAQLKDLNETNVDISPTRPRYQVNNEYSIVSNNTNVSPDKTLFNIDSIRNMDSNSSQSVIVSNPNKNRVLIPSSQKRQSISPNKNEFTAIRDRMQAMQIINQYIKESQMTLKQTSSSQGMNMQYNNDPYNFFVQQQQQLYQQSPDKTQYGAHAYNTEKKPNVMNQLQVNKPMIMDENQLTHKRQASNNPQNYYFDSNPNQNAMLLQQIHLQRGLSEGHPQSINSISANQRTLEFKDIVISSQLSNHHPSQLQNLQQSNRLPAANTQNQNQSQSNQNNTNSQINQSMRSLSGNTYLRQKQGYKTSEEYNYRMMQQHQLNSSGTVMSHNTINNNSLPQASNSMQKTQFNPQQLMQNGNGNSRATTLPQLNNDSLQKSQAIKQNKSQSFYEGLKAQGSFKLGNGGVALNFKNDLKATSEEQFFNSSFIKGNVSPLPFENVPHYTFKIKPTMIAQKNSSKQLNSNQVTNESKRLYQSQPIEEFTPQSTQNKEQLSTHISQKWTSKNRAQQNLNSGNIHASSNNMTAFISTTQQSNTNTNIGATNISVDDIKKQQQQASLVKKRKPSDSVGANATSKSFIQNSTSNNLFLGSTAKRPKGPGFKKNKL